MVSIGIIACEKMMDKICPGCLKCFKAVWEGAGMFTEYDPAELNITYITSCGGCPGFIVNKVGMMRGYGKFYERDVDVIHIGTCIQSAATIGRCPIDLEQVKKKLEEKFGKKVVIGTHPYPP
ncbi:MAG: CGGC domain-containing protein [Nitrososphaerota archaeon]